MQHLDQLGKPDRLWLSGAATLLPLLVMASASHAAPQTFTVLNEAGQPLAQAVVSVVTSRGEKPNGAGTVVDMGQRNRQFTPTVVAVPVGGAVNFPNYDTVRHHVYSFSATKKFEIKLYAGTPAAPVVFDKPGTVTLFCEVHDHMYGVILVVDSPHFARTDADGNFRLEGLPAGTHTFKVWLSPKQTVDRTVDLKPGENTVDWTKAS